MYIETSLDGTERDLTKEAMMTILHFYYPNCANEFDQKMRFDGERITCIIH